jgi:hypothetical protein
VPGPWASYFDLASMNARVCIKRCGVCCWLFIQSILIGLKKNLVNVITRILNILFTVSQGRRSMRFAKHLQDVSNKFRARYLDSVDVADNTVLDPDWRNMWVRKFVHKHLFLLGHKS